MATKPAERKGQQYFRESFETNLTRGIFQAIYSHSYLKKHLINNYNYIQNMDE